MAKKTQATHQDPCEGARRRYEPHAEPLGERRVGAGVAEHWPASRCGLTPLSDRLNVAAYLTRPLPMACHPIDKTLCLQVGSPEWHR